MKKIGFLLIPIITTSIYADIESGKKVYAANCAQCHSTKMTGGLGKDFNLVSYSRKKEEIANYTRDPYSMYEKFGYSANAMPTLLLEEQDIKDVADFIDSLQPFKEWMKKKKV
ncbi:MAG: cytochrome c [Campylobacterota bacterium]|nr:cytochrome c [Campylobacterota bacterium]